MNLDIWFNRITVSGEEQPRVVDTGRVGILNLSTLLPSASSRVSTLAEIGRTTDGPGQLNRRVFVKVLADLRRVGVHLNTMLAQVVCWPDSGQHQQLG